MHARARSSLPRFEAKNRAFKMTKKKLPPQHLNGRVRGAAAKKTTKTGKGDSVSGGK